MGLFGKAEVKQDPKDAVREWTRRLRKEQRGIDRSVRQIEMEERKVEAEIKVAAKRGDVGCCKVLAKEIVRSRAAKNRLHESQAHMNSVAMALQSNLVNMKMSGHLQSSTEVMAGMSKLINYPEMKQNMQEMSKEMTKMGLIEEGISDAMDALDPEGIDDDADGEVEKVMEELAAGVLTQLPSSGTKLPQQQQAAAAAPDLESQALEQRLGAL